MLRAKLFPQLKKKNNFCFISPLPLWYRSNISPKSNPPIYFPERIFQQSSSGSQDLLHSSQSGTSEGRENEASLVDVGVVVPAQLLFLLGSPAAQWRCEIAISILAADHEADLAAWVSWNGSVGIFDVRENLPAVLLELGDQWEVDPLVLSWGGG